MRSYRYNNLVYIPFTKHASTSYTELFENKLNWEPTYSDLINWETDHVFAHLLHPYTRHLKGITECIANYGLHDFVGNNKFLKLLGTAVFDLHSYPLSPALGENRYKIDWLPLDHHKVSGGRLTIKLLKSHGIEILESDIPNLNVKTKNEASLLAKISEIRDSQDLTGTLTYFYEQDVMLYGLVNQSLRFHEIDNLHWDQCSWLSNYKDILAYRAMLNINESSTPRT